jgi:PAS domain S-box-containing protein
MDQKSEANQGFDKLRQQAEKIVREKPSTLGDLSTQDVQSLLEELRIYQIELELQNQELREAQVKLQLAYDRYLDLYDFAPVGYFTLNQANLIQEVNLTGVALLGVERRRLLNQSFTQFISRETQDIYYFHYQRLFETRLPQNCEVSLLRGDGAQFQAHLESAPAPGQQGQVASYRVTVIDITERKQAEQALRAAHAELEQRVAERTAALAQANTDLEVEIAERKRTEELLQKRNRELTLLSQSARAFISSLDLDETLVTVLEAIRHLLQVTACRAWLIDLETKELICQQVNHRGEGESISGRRLALGEGLAGWVAQYGQSLIVTDIRTDPHQFKDVDPELDAQIRSVLSLPLRIKQQVIGVLQALDTTVERFTTADLTLLEPLAATAAMAVENARLYEQAQEDMIKLRQLNTQLQSRNEELDAFAHTVAHQLKNSSSLITTFGNILKTGVELPESMQLYLDSIIQSGHKMNNVITELQLLAGIRIGQVELNPLNMVEIVAEARQRLMYAIEERQAQIVAPDRWPTAWGYGPWVEEVWVNYIGNAVKYGGEPPLVELGATIQADQFICFWVRDNGPGIPPEQQAQIFKPFIRHDQIKIEGHGLGLAIVRHIVEKLGGQVGIESDGISERGSVFTFTLPQHPPRQADSQ